MTARVVGRCQRCGQDVHAGDEQRITVHAGTGAAPDVLLHSSPCKPRLGVRPRNWT